MKTWRTGWDFFLHTCYLQFVQHLHFDWEEIRNNSTAGNIHNGVHVKSQLFFLLLSGYFLGIKVLFKHWGVGSWKLCGFLFVCLFCFVVAFIFHKKLKAINAFQEIDYALLFKAISLPINTNVCFYYFILSWLKRTLKEESCAPETPLGSFLLTLLEKSLEIMW